MANNYRTGKIKLSHEQWITNDATRKRLILEKSAIEKELAEFKLWFRLNQHLDYRPSEPGKLDRYDLENAISEPITLLHRAYCCLIKATKRGARTEDDRGVMDACEGYLKRQGVLI